MPYLYFDLGNVLVHFDPNQACRNVGRLIGAEEAEVFAALYGSGIETRYERGELDDEQFAAAFFQQIAGRCETQDLLREMSAMFTPHQEMVAIIDTLVAARQRGDGPELGVLSNTCAAHWRWVQEQRWSVCSGWFRDAVLSYEVGHMKPEPEIYAAAAERANCPPGELYFTDDRAENVEAARQAGWQAEVFRGAEPFLKTLRQWGIAPADR